MNPTCTSQPEDLHIVRAVLERLKCACLLPQLRVTQVAVGLRADEVAYTSIDVKACSFWVWVCGGLGICVVCWERGEFCVCCVGVWVCT